MNLNTAASIGLGLLGKSNNIGMALGAANALGKGFEGIAKRLHLNEALSGAVDSVMNNAPSRRSGTLQVLTSTAFFDADRNGQITQTELQNGLKKLDESGFADKPGAQKLHQLGENMLKNYQKVAALDGQAGGISYADLGLLANKDNHPATLSAADWSALNT